MIERIILRVNLKKFKLITQINNINYILSQCMFYVKVTYFDCELYPGYLER